MQTSVYSNCYLKLISASGLQQRPQMYLWNKHPFKHNGPQGYLRNEHPFKHNGKGMTSIVQYTHHIHTTIPQSQTLESIHRSTETTNSFPSPRPWLADSYHLAHLRPLLYNTHYTAPLYPATTVSREQTLCFIPRLSDIRKHPSIENLASAIHRQCQIQHPFTHDKQQFMTPVRSCVHIRPNFLESCHHCVSVTISDYLF